MRLMIPSIPCFGFILIFWFLAILIWFCSNVPLNSVTGYFSGTREDHTGAGGETGSLRSPREVFLLQDINEAPEEVVDEKEPQSAETEEKCSHFSCFDVYRCHVDAEKIAVYVYPIKRYLDSSGILISSPITEQFWQLLEAIIESPFYTNDPEKACLFVPSLDLLSQSYVRLEETSQVLNSLPFWGKDGSNHLLFNMLPGSFPDYNRRLDINSGKAIVAGGGFDTWTYRPSFDVSIPVYSPLNETRGANRVLHKSKTEGRGKAEAERRWLIICSQANAISGQMKKTLSQLEEEHQDELLVVGNHCPTESATNVSTQKRCSESRKVALDYPFILTNASFCIVSRTAYLGSPLLSDALMSGCIPVIVADNYVLPFEDKIDWKRASVRIHEHSLSNIMAILKSISEERIDDMRQQGFFIWNSYFSSMKAIILTTLHIINERIFPNTVASREEWNSPTLTQIHRPLALVSPKFSSRVSSGFTAVVLTYDRVDSLFEVIHRVVQAPSCVKVVVVWNNQVKKPPSAEKWPRIHVPLRVIQTEANKISNRFYPFSNIETEAILAIDDDIVMLNPDELEFGFQVWREFPDRIVGFPARVHRWDDKAKKWRYESEWTNDISMVLTGAAYYHKYYNYLYSFVMPNEIKTWVDQQMNCEDIAMNFLVANVTGKGPVKVTPRKKFKCPECTNVEMLSADVVRHLTERSECINRFASVYGTMPLKTVEFRADPVLYKDNLPEKLKKFNQIGSL